MRIVSLGKKTVIVWIIAVVFWVLDRVFCDFWVKLDLPYFHSVFHLIAFYSSYWSIVLYSYFKAIDTVPQFKATINYWPESDSISFISIPYVQLIPQSSLESQYILINENESSIDQDYKFA